VRAFIGTLLSPANQAVSDAFGRRIADATLGMLRPVPPRSAHITHVFLGDVDEANVEAVTIELQELLRSIPAVQFRLGRPEILLAGREPRLVLARVEAGGPQVSDVTRRIVNRLRRHVALACSAARSPHVTLARFRRSAGSREASQVSSLLASPHAAPDWTDDRLDEVQLIQSDLTPGGPVYKVVARAPSGRLA
jgi:RNA 2',3'-cyclic 3'-phosphodiesterase